MQSEAFEAICREVLASGGTVRFEARGASMSPAIRDGEIVYVRPLRKAPKTGDVLMVRVKDGMRLHRLVRRFKFDNEARDLYVTRGDCGQEDDAPVESGDVLGIAEVKEVRWMGSSLRIGINSLTGRLMQRFALARAAVARTLGVVAPVAALNELRKKSASAHEQTSGAKAPLRSKGLEAQVELVPIPQKNLSAQSQADALPETPRPLFPQAVGRCAKQYVNLAAACLGALLLAAAGISSAQVAVDTTNSRAAQFTGPGTANFTRNHTTNVATHGLLVVGVEMNIANAPATAVTGITYNGTALTFLGAHNDAGATRRVEMWYLLAPAVGTFPISININIPVAQTVGAAFGATTFSGVDQTVPIGGFYSGDGAGGTNSQLDVPSVVNGMIFDALATGGPVTVTTSGPQLSLYNRFSGGADPPDVNGSGSSRTGAPSVPISETFDQASNWSLGAVSINPTAADIGVSTTVSAVALGASSTYNITVFNNGPSAATGVMLTDTLAASGLTLNSVTPSAGVTCVGTGPITCTIGALASGATATVVVKVTASAAGYYPNTATVADSGTPPDPNTGNNTYVALAPVQSIACSATTPSAGTTLTGVVNAYYPGTASVAAAAKSIPVGTPTGTGTIATGSLLLVIQMQDASINTSNTGAYGNGSTGQGFTAVNNSGNYEFVYATGAVSGGAVPITGAGVGGGLVFGYTTAALTATKGQSTYQVVLVPQYTSATLGTGLTAAAWNGLTGGILALDVAGTLSLGTAAVGVDGKGFRGGAGLQLNGGVGGAGTDYLHASPAAYTGVNENGVDAPKGEGIAGTPLYVESGVTYLNTAEGYPSGVAGTDGSMARGAPGNAGGGGTDSDPAGNSQNAGGGGGANGGSGGFGGDSWKTNLSSGGEGGVAFPSTIDRLALGGGGGAGSRNNSDGDNQASGGSPGGGIIFIRAGALSGTATLTANGSNSYNGTANDSGGGGGAGGTIVVLSLNGGEGGLTLKAQGGRGGDAWDAQPYSLADRHGPGGGGGGGAVYVSAAPASISVIGGTNGTTLKPPSANYGATPGLTGTSATTATLQQVTGVQSGAACTPDLTLQKTHVGTFVRGTAASFTIPVQNLSLYGPTTGVVTMNDTLPLGLTPASASGTGWTCSIASQTVSCVRSDALAAGAVYPSIALNVSVVQTAPAVVTNTATIGGGGEANLANDTATDTAQVISTADLSVGVAASPNPVAAGSNVTYTFSVNDLGPSAADNATLSFPIPANSTFASLTPPAGWSCSSPGVGLTGTVVCTTLTMTGGTAASFVLAVKVNNGTANGTVISGTASVGSSVNDPVPGNNTATATSVVGTTSPDLTVTNSVSPKPVQAGGSVTYTQVVTNTGTSAVTSATFTEATPANETFVSIVAPAGWTCVAFPPTCTNPSVAAGATGTFTVVYTVNAGTAAGTVLTDTATVNGANQSFGASSATATDVVASAAQADLALSTAATPSTVLAGNNITYTQTITNNGPSAATNATFTEVIPANTTFSSVSAPAGWTCTITTSVSCSNPSVAPGATIDILVVLNVSPTVAAGTITANSSVSATTSDPTSANNSTTVVTAVNPACNLTVVNTGTPSPVAAGGTITYTQTVSNSGPSNCSTATFTEPTPANTTFASVAVTTTGGGTWTCTSAPVSCTNPSVPPGSTGTITAKYTVSGAATAGTIISDTATAGSATRDTNLADNSATVNIAVASGTQADLSVTNASPNPVTAGSNITYTQTVTNNGPAAATTVVFSDPIPANTSVVSLTGPAGWTCSIATTPPSCTIASLAANTTANFSFVVTVSATAASGTISQTDSVSSATGDPNIANNSATASVQVSPSADLSVSDASSPVPVQAGNNITYTQVITNSGPSTATSVTLTEALPANTTAQTLTGPAGWTCNVGTLTCTIATLGTGPTGSFSFVVKVNAGTAAGTAINDTVTVGSAVSDPNSANNTATAADVVATATQADLVVTNTPSSATVSPGANVTYTQTVTNNGPAAATAPTFNQTIPPNETFQSITAPAGWTCTTPAVGSTGNISCTDGSSLAIAAPASFTVVLGVNSNTASGTYISDTATASASNIVPGLTTNSATATVLVASANSAEVAITKIGTPNPVSQGGTLIYTLTVTNNGPATATNVTATDILPSSVTYLSVTPPAGGTCSEAGGTVTCQLGSMTNGMNATITILTIAARQGSVQNTATVTASETDPNPGNNTFVQTETITAATRIQLQDFQAGRFKDSTGAWRTALTWKTSGEAHNLGFNVYSDAAGQHTKLNPSLIAGSALLMNGALPKHGAKTYTWIDATATGPAVSYWLEDVDVSGARTMHGPVSAASFDGAASSLQPSSLLDRLNQSQPAAAFTQASYNSEAVFTQPAPTSSQTQKQFELAAGPAVKLYVKHEGWYRVTQPELVKSGLDPNVDPDTLQLYAEAIQQPIEITGATPGAGGFGPQAAINFYGTGMDTQYTGTRVYWLVTGRVPGLRIHHLPASEGSNLPPASFLSTVELKPRTTYFSALITKDGDNFFGPLVSSVPLDQKLYLAHLDVNAPESAQLDVTLRGVITANPHDVSIALNGVSVGNLTYTGQAEGRFHLDLPPGALTEGTNVVTLTSQNGQYDYSLVDTIRIAYPHKYFTDLGRLKFSARAGEEVAFNSAGAGPVVVLDITDPGLPIALTPQVTLHGGRYEAKMQVPWTSTSSSSGARHTLLALDEAQVAHPLGLRPNHPSRWHSRQPGAEIAMITAEELAPALKPLAKQRAKEGKSSAIISVTEIYDEFNFGERSPDAIRDFLQMAHTNWTTPPSFLLLNGRASIDPRNYLGFGHLDMVPTKIVPTAALMTASDDWFSDFNQTGLPTIATGRLPVGSPAEASLVVSKITSYAGTATNGAWTSQALMVADRDDADSFSQDSLSVQAKLPSTISATDIFVSKVGVTAARQQIVAGINSGKLLVNYLGHGSEDQWSGADLFDNTAASALTNGSSLPVFLVLNCLNGFFQDVYGQPLGVTLLLTPNGGAVAVLSSSGLNQAGPQVRLDRMVVQGLFQGSHNTLGEAIMQAKQRIVDPDVRKTYILFGDPAMAIKTPGTATAAPHLP